MAAARQPHFGQRLLRDAGARKAGIFGSSALVKHLVAILNDGPALANASMLAAGRARPGDGPNLALVKAVEDAVKYATSPGVGPALLCWLGLSTTAVVLVLRARNSATAAAAPCYTVTTAVSLK